MNQRVPEPFRLGGSRNCQLFLVADDPHFFAGKRMDSPRHKVGDVFFVVAEGVFSVMRLDESKIIQVMGIAGN